MSAQELPDPAFTLRVLALSALEDVLAEHVGIKLVGVNVERSNHEYERAGRKIFQMMIRNAHFFVDAEVAIAELRNGTYHLEVVLRSYRKPDSDVTESPNARFELNKSI